MKVKTPRLWPPLGVTKREHDDIVDLYATLTGLEFNIEAWAAGLELYKFAKSRPSQVKPDLARKWRFIAVSECIMQIFHLRERMDIIRGQKLRACPAVASLVNKSALRRANSLFDAHFPDFEKLRHSRAHQGSVDSRYREHAPIGMMAFSGFRNGDKYETTYKGAVLHLEMTDETLRQLTNVVSTFFDGFAPAAPGVRMR